MVRVGCLFALALALAPARAHAQEGGGPIAIELRAPPLHAGDRAELIARVRGAGVHPLLLTPRSEGTAIEVVRGRLLRAEAVDPSTVPSAWVTERTARQPSGVRSARPSTARSASAAVTNTLRARRSSTARASAALEAQASAPGIRTQLSDEVDAWPVASSGAVSLGASVCFGALPPWRAGATFTICEASARTSRQRASHA